MERIKGRFVKGTSGNPKGRPNLADSLSSIDFTHSLALQDPQTECEVRERFRIINEVFGIFDIVISQETFPDFLLRAKTGKLIRAEVETKSSHFVDHKHDIEKCDLIICWIHNWKACPIPVLPVAHMWFSYKQLNSIGAFMEFQFAKEILDRMTV